MKNVFFKPWIGSKYGKPNSIFSHKILVLGDSHYIDEPVDLVINDASEPSDFTTGVMLDYLEPNLKGRWQSTFTKFMNSFIKNSTHSARHRSELWHSVAFYNYLQVPAGSDNRQTQYYDYTHDRDRSAFLEVINYLDPDIIISWGNKVWDAIPEDLGYGNCHVSEVHSNCCYLYPFKQRELKLIGITHPSTSFNSDSWANVFDELGANE